MSDERALLAKYLGMQRRHVLEQVDGLSDHAMQRAMLPSGWTPAGLVQHLAVDVERWWFRRILRGEPLEFDGGAWTVEAGVAPASVIALYKEEIERADAIIAATPLDAPMAWWPEDQWPDWRLEDLRDVILHVVAETACHAGHLDAARELMDGKQWIIAE
ncbi:MAG TPA: DinB family protein [Acidimicrobiales bacterium]|nr:DinB family protein [Acidimicrobiales bacterium]